MSFQIIDRHWRPKIRGRGIKECESEILPDGVNLNRTSARCSRCGITVPVLTMLFDGVVRKVLEPKPSRRSRKGRVHFSI